MKKILFLFLTCSVAFSQDVIKVEDTASTENSERLNLRLDVVNRYLWRGQCWGGNYVAVQPSVEYEVIPNLIIGSWATTNFKKDYFYSDGVSAYKGYQEIDVYLTYQLFDFLQLQVWDYYWPSVSKVEGVNNNYFNYKSSGVKTVDAILYLDFSDYKYPFNATISTLIAGNDYRYNTQGENPKQNYTTYLELGYTFSLFENVRFKPVQNIELSPTIGAVLNNKAAYYTYADYDKISFTNLSLKAEKGIDLGHKIYMPISINYIHNAATNNTELFGRNFLVSTISICY